jgi:hypothetical protein
MMPAAHARVYVQYTAVKYIGTYQTITLLLYYHIVRDPDPKQSLKNEVTPHRKIYLADHDFLNVYVLAEQNKVVCSAGRIAKVEKNAIFNITLTLLYVH